MTDERTPLLTTVSSTNAENQVGPSTPSSSLPKVKDYDRFTTKQKRFIVAICAWCGFLPFFVSGAFMPSIPSVVEDFHTSPALVGLAISVSVFSAAIGGLTGAAFSGAYGRRPTYLYGSSILFVGSLGVATSQSIGPLLFWRFSQEFGAAPGLSVGAGVIGDIFRLEERGTFMGIFLSACLVGAAAGPPVGGFLTNYFSWRIMQGSMGLAGLFGFTLIFLLFPETLLPEHRVSARKQDENDHATNQASSRLRTVANGVWTFLRNVNPFGPLWMLKSPIVFFIAFAGFTILLTDFVLLVPLAYTIAAKYGIHTTAGIGACYLPMGIGNMVGAPIAGKISDHLVVRHRQKRGGVWYPEDRLRITVVDSLTLVPLSILGSGLATQFVDGTVGLVVNLICLFINGVGVTTTLSTINAYMVDVLHERSAESVAAMGAFRATAVAITVSGIIPMIERYGVAVTNGAAAIFAWFGGFILWITVRYGAQLRSWVGIGYSKSPDGR